MVECCLAQVVNGKNSYTPGKHGGCETGAVKDTSLKCKGGRYLMKITMKADTVNPTVWNVASL